MQKQFILIALSSVSLLAADQYNSPKDPALVQDQPANLLSTDDQIAKSIHEILTAKSLSKAYQSITFEVNEGVVTLDGKVDTKATQTQIETEVRKLDGVKQVNSTIAPYEGQPAEPRNRYPLDYAATTNDKDLIKRMRQTLGDHWTGKGYDTFVIRSTRGVVTISGAVPQFEDIQKVADEIKATSGVRALNNKLAVTKIVIRG